MADLTVWGIVFIITLSEVVSKTQLFIHGNSHGFIPANNEVRYLVDELPLHKEFSSGGAVRISKFEEDTFVSSPHLRLNPRILDFKDRHLGVPHHEKVIVYNTNGNKTIQLTSIAGNTVHFHSSFFEDKVIPPLGNTSFSVVFLGREEGVIESNLFIHTSEGSIKYPVRGNSISSPYRIRPLVGVHMPINASFAPLIHMHNPHPTPIQIVEIYSSGGELSLELPTGEIEAAKKIWEILPFETKPVIRARLLAQANRNHTCYVRIRVNGSSEHLVVPLEVEVGSTPGLYPPDPSLDLGVLGSEFPPTRLSLLLHNSGRKSTLIQNVFTVPATKAVKIDFHSIRVPPDSKVATEVAVITFDPQVAYEEKHFSGKIVVKGKNRLVIPYHARVLQGGLKFNASLASFCTDQMATGDGDTAHDSLLLLPRNFTVRNTFLFPLVIGNVSLAQEAEKYFQILHFNPLVLAPGEEVMLFQLAPNISSLEPNFHLESYIQIITNVSAVTVPLLCYDGHIMKVIPPGEQGDEGERDSLELGLVGVGGSREVEFALLNPNPVDVTLEAWGLELRATGEVAAATVELLGIGSGSQADVLSYWASSPVNLTQSTTLQPRHYAMFRVSVVAGLEEGYSTLDIYVKTPFERHIIPLKIHVVKGNIKLEPEVIIFDNCFPGKVSTQALQVHSTFQQSMRVMSLQSLQQPDPRLSFVKLADVAIRPFGTTALGELLFDPRLKCADHCYLGIDLESTAGAQWLQGFALSAGDKVWEQDANLLSTLYMWFLGSISAPRSWLNCTLRLDTSEVRGHRLQVATRLTWPSLASELPQKHLSFPLTQVGNTTTKVIPILNPADSPILLQIILGELYSPGRSVLDILPVMLHPPLREASGDADQSEFSMSGPWQRTPEEMQSIIGISPHKRSLSLVLQPKAVFNLQVHFSPQAVSPVSSLLYIRNNLTVLEVLRVSGQGAMAQFKFGNRKPGSATPLQFDLSEKHLKDCSKNKMRKSPLPLLTVKRSFTARNTGELPIYISNFLINDLPCEGFGFKVLNCKPFLLTANSSRKVEIAFSPDFTLARVQRVLKIITSLGPSELGTVNYSLVATLPVSLLVPCGQAIPRPPWEAVFYYCMVVFMMFLLFCVVAFALIESDRIHKCSMIVAVAAATAALSRSNPKGPSMSTIFHSVTHSQSIPANKVEVAERKRDLNISTNSRTQPDIGKEKRSHSPADSQDDSLQETLHKPETTRNCTGSTSPQPSLSNTRSSKRKLPKKQGTGNFETCDGHQTNPSEDTNSPSPSPPSNASPKPQNESRNAVVWSGVFVRSTGSKAATKASVEQDESIKFSPKEQGTAKRSNAHQIKGNRKNRASSEIIPGSEEDTSSTTTEGSTNDEVEKEHGQAKAGRENLNRDSYEGDGEEEEEEPRTRRNTTKTSKHTKAALEQPVSDVSNGSQSTNSSSSGRNTGSSNNVSSRHSSSEHSLKSKPSKQQSREKVLPRPPAPSKQRRNQQDRLERSSLRVVSESDSGNGKGHSAPPITWEHPISAPSTASQESNSDPASVSPLLYSKIVSPLPESPPPVPPVMSLPASVPEINRKKEAPGPIGPKPPPKRAMPQMPSHVSWDFPERMTYTSGMPGAAVVNNPLDTGLLDVFAEPSGLLVDGGGWEQTPSNSVFRVLQEERRRRVEQHQQRMFRESWPRLEMNWEPPPLYSPPTTQVPVPNPYGAPGGIPDVAVVTSSAEALWEPNTQAGMWNSATAWLTPTSSSGQQHEQAVPPNSPLESAMMETTPQFNLFGSKTSLWDLPHASWNQGAGAGDARNQP